MHSVLWQTETCSVCSCSMGASQSKRVYAQLVNIISRNVAHNRMCHHSLENTSCNLRLRTNWARINLDCSGEILTWIVQVICSVLNCSLGSAKTYEANTSILLSTVWAIAASCQHAEHYSVSPKWNIGLLSQNDASRRQFFKSQATQTGHIMYCKPVIL